MRDLFGEFGITIVWLIVSTLALFMFIGALTSPQFQSIINLFLKGVMG